MTRSRMQLWADDPGDAVLWAGGLICDHALGGWEVVVLLPHHSCDRALSILGAQVGLRESHGAQIDSAGPVLAISATADDLGQASRVRSYVCGPLGGSGPGFRHRLSAGARAFKAHALRAAGLDAEVAAAETFRLTRSARSAMPQQLALAHGRIGGWPNAGQCNDASITPGACC